jgi:hypothetical protein
VLSLFSSGSEGDQVNKGEKRERGKRWEVQGLERGKCKG